MLMIMIVVIIIIMITIIVGHPEDRESGGRLGERPDAAGRQPAGVSHANNNNDNNDT